MRFATISTILSVVLLSCFSNLGASQDFSAFDSQNKLANFPDTANGRLTAVPEINAYRIKNGSINLDGRLDDPVWIEAETAAGFRVWDPNRGEITSEETTFKIAYDKEAIYVGVACWENDIDNVADKLCRRDQISSSDFIGVYIDPYYDKTTAFNFMVNPSGVLGDRYVYNDGEMDPDWNGVWEAGTSKDDHGWYAEYRIPFSCLRYRHSDEMTWGLNVYRFMSNRGEDTGWTVWDRETRGFVSRFGKLRNLKDIPKVRQLEILPYFAHSTTSNPDSDDKLHHYDNFGADLKYGITANLTLNATFQPDFGQVEADPTELNLSPFETQYSEKRPFFLEGAQYFWHPDFVMFYSRRIGTGDENSRIRAAGKLIGKTANGISIAGLYATTDITNEGQAHNFVKSGMLSSHYIFTRLGKEFNDGTHRINIAQSAVYKSGDRDTYGNMFTRDAWTTGADFDLNFRDRRYNIHGSFIGSVVDPAPLASDPSVAHNKIYGTGGVFKMSKLGGNLTGGLTGEWKSDKLDINDFGYISSPDDIEADAWIEYEYHPDNENSLFRNGNLEADFSQRWLYAGRKGYDRDTGEQIWSYDRIYPQSLELDLEGWGQFRNYWEIWGGIYVESESRSKYETRRFDGVRGPLMREPAVFVSWLGFNTDHRRALKFKLNLKSVWNEAGYRNPNAALELRWNATNTMTYKLEAAYETYHFDAHHIDNFANPGGGIGGVSYLFAELDQETVDMTLRGDLLFNRNLSLQLYAQPYLTIGNFYHDRELIRPDSYDLERPAGIPDSIFSDVSDYDFRYASVNFNAVLRWEFGLGSALYLVWKHERFADEERLSLTNEGKTFNNDLDPSVLFDNKPKNVFLMKVSYWMPV